MISVSKENVVIEVPDFFVSDYKKFVLLETLKAKAKQIKELGHDRVDRASSR